MCQKHGPNPALSDVRDEIPSQRFRTSYCAGVYAMCA